jgi:hypothetical protein
VTEFAAALYDADGVIVKASAADAGCTYDSGTYLVWPTVNILIPDQISDAPGSYGRAQFGMK